ncbi:hypothetical protein HP439_13080, partial [Sphingobacterium shayense]|uniref:hypothetical protein n=1 Tax=Sphingobacterium shayense TaxID=626343 RepID=UPI001555E178
MKVSLLIVVLFLIINKTNGQAYMANHAGRSAYIYEHSLLKISPEYPAENRTHIYADKSVAIENIGSKSLKKEEVLGDTFKVLNVINIDYTTKLLELERLSNSSILYYRYTIFHGVDFPFNIVKMDIQKDLVMKEIEYSKDDFTKSETYRTPISGNNKFHLIKIKDKGQIHFYLTLQTTGITPNVNQKGVYLLFEDGRVWDKPDVDVDIEV